METWAEATLARGLERGWVATLHFVAFYPGDIHNQIRLAPYVDASVTYRPDWYRAGYDGVFGTYNSYGSFEGGDLDAVKSTRTTFFNTFPFALTQYDNDPNLVIALTADDESTIYQRRQEGAWVDTQVYNQDRLDQWVTLMRLRPGRLVRVIHSRGDWNGTVRQVERTSGADVDNVDRYKVTCELFGLLGQTERPTGPITPPRVEILRVGLSNYGSNQVLG